MKIEVRVQNREIKCEIEGTVEGFKEILHSMNADLKCLKLFEAGFDFSRDSVRSFEAQTNLSYLISDEADAYIVLEKDNFQFKGNEDELKFLWNEACKHDIFFRSAFFNFWLEIYTKQLEEEKEQLSRNKIKLSEGKKQLLKSRIRQVILTLKIAYYKFFVPIEMFLSILFLAPGVVVTAFIFFVSVFLNLIPDEHVPDMRGALKKEFSERDKEIWDRLVKISNHVSWCFWIFVVAYIVLG